MSKNTKSNFIEVTPAGAASELCFNFPCLGAAEKMKITFHKTLRIPDDNKQYPLPPSLGSFPLSHTSDYEKNLPPDWVQRQGVFFPMRQSEAMWLSFSSDSGRPYAVKIAAGKINAISGEPWSDALVGKPKIQSGNTRQSSEQELTDYATIPRQPWLDGFNAGKDVIRQFVAMPLGEGYTVEEQITGKAEFGGLQIIVYPMKESVWNDIRIKQGPRSMRSASFGGCITAGAQPLYMAESASMGLAAGGLMTQQIYEDEYGLEAWDTEQSLRLFVHLLNSNQYKSVTGKEAPAEMMTREVYERYNYPWFSYYQDAPTIAASEKLSKVDSVASMQVKKGQQVLDENTHSPAPGSVVDLSPQNKNSVKTGKW